MRINLPSILIDAATMKEIRTFGHEDDYHRGCLFCADEYIVHTNQSGYLSVYESKGFTRMGKYKLKWKNWKDYDG